MPPSVRNKSGSAKYITRVSASSNDMWIACSKRSCITSLVLVNSTISQVNLTFSGSCVVDGSIVTVKTGCFVLCRSRFYSNVRSLISIVLGSCLSGVEKLTSTRPVYVILLTLGTGLGNSS